MACIPPSKLAIRRWAGLRDLNASLNCQHGETQQIAKDPTYIGRWLLLRSWAG